MTRHRSTTSNGVEWIGGVFEIVVPRADNHEDARANMALWLAAPNGLTMSERAEEPNRPPAELLAAALEDALRRPDDGAARRPTLIHVADDALAAACRALLPDVPINVGPTPEIDLVARMLRHETRSPSLDDLGIDADAFSALPDSVLAELFLEARSLYEARPWELVRGERPLRLHMPAHGVDEGCAVVVSGEGARGLVLFPSLATHDAFDKAISELDRRGKVDPGAMPALPPVSWISLDFVPNDEIPKEARALFASRGWDAAARGFCPSVSAVEDGEPRACSADDVRKIIAAAHVVAVTCKAHASTLRRDEPLYATVKRDGTSDAELDIPHPEAKLTGLATSKSVGRNDPCPCGSGKKYKKCHLQGGDDPETSPAQETIRRQDVSW